MSENLPLDSGDAYPDKKITEVSPEHTYVALRGYAYVLGVFHSESGRALGFMEIERLGHKTVIEWLRAGGNHPKIAIAELRWVVDTILDRGPREHYRYHITGRIVDAGRLPEKFSWSVPSLDDPRYDLTTARRERVGQEREARLARLAILDLSGRDPADAATGT